MFKKLKYAIIDFKKYIPLLINLTSRDIKVKYRKSVLGLAWSILNPLLTMIVITQVLGRLLKVQIPYFPVYYILGSAIYNFFSEATTSSMSSILTAAPLIKKVHIPKYIFPLEKCMFAFVNFLFSLIAVAIVMIAQPILANDPVTFSPPWATMPLFFLPVLYCFVFSIGCSLILSAMTVFFRDILHLYSVFLTVLMYLTPIIYPMSLLDNSKLAIIVKCNPLYYFVEYFRSVMMDGVVPGLEMNLICIGLALSALVVGLIVFKLRQDKFILHI